MSFVGELLFLKALKLMAKVSEDLILIDKDIDLDKIH